MNVSEISLRVNRPMSYLADIWKRDTIHGLADSLGAPAPPYKPGNPVNNRMRKTLFPRGEFGACKEKEHNFSDAIR